MDLIHYPPKIWTIQKKRILKEFQLWRKLTAIMKRVQTLVTATDSILVKNVISERLIPALQANDYKRARACEEVIRNLVLEERYPR